MTRPPTLRPSLLLLASLAIALPASLGAQRPAPMPVFHPSVSLDASIGPGGVVGGDLLDRFVVAFDATIALRIRERARSSWLVAGSGGIQGPITNTSVCDAAPDFDCRKQHPVFYSSGLLIGWEETDARAPVMRVLVGPTWYQSEVRGTAGLQARLDYAIPTPTHYAPLLSLRTALLYDYEGATLGFAALGLGFRIR